MKASTVTVLGLAIVSMTLAGCSGSDSTSSSSTAGAAECSASALQPAIDQQAASLGAGNTITGTSVQCSGTWAVVQGTIEPKQEPITLIFASEGGTWAWQEPEAVCGASADASEVPKDLYPTACAQ